MSYNIISFISTGVHKETFQILDQQLILFLQTMSPSHSAP